VIQINLLPELVVEDHLPQFRCYAPWSSLAQESAATPVVVCGQWSVYPDVSFVQDILQLQMLQEQNWKDRSCELKRKRTQ